MDESPAQSSGSLRAAAFFDLDRMRINPRDIARLFAHRSAQSFRLPLPAS